jgi:hypothetical protein
LDGAPAATGTGEEVGFVAKKLAKLRKRVNFLAQPLRKQLKHGGG